MLLWISIGLIWLFIFMIAFFGNYETKQQEKEYKYYNMVVGREKPTTFNFKKYLQILKKVFTNNVK